MNEDKETEAQLSTRSRLEQDLQDNELDAEDADSDSEYGELMRPKMLEYLVLEFIKF